MDFYILYQKNDYFVAKIANYSVVVNILMTYTGSRVEHCIRDDPLTLPSAVQYLELQIVAAACEVTSAGTKKRITLPPLS